MATNIDPGQYITHYDPVLNNWLVYIMVSIGTFLSLVWPSLATYCKDAPSALLCMNTHFN